MTKRIIYTDTDMLSLLRERHADYMAYARRLFADGRNGAGIINFQNAANTRRHIANEIQRRKVYDIRLIDGRAFIESGGFSISDDAKRANDQQEAA